MRRRAYESEESEVNLPGQVRERAPQTQSGSARRDRRIPGSAQSISNQRVAFSKVRDPWDVYVFVATVEKYGGAREDANVKSGEKDFCGGEEKASPARLPSSRLQTETPGQIRHRNLHQQDEPGV